MVAWSAHTSAADADDEEWLRLEAVRKLRRLNAAAMEKRRRIKAALLALDGGQGPQGGKRREESPFSWDDHISQLTEQKFKLRYRLTFDGFNKLLDNGEFGIRGDLEAVDTKMAKRAKWGYLVSAETKLAICLRYLAGASILDLELIYKVSSSYAYQCVWTTVDAINRRLVVEFPIDDPHKLRVLEAEWRSKAMCAEWRGQVAAVDGVHFPMVAPSSNVVPDPMRYHVARKDEYALLCMALCDAEGVILDYDISQVPQTHDSLAWSLMELGRKVSEGKLRAPYFINGDAAFPLSNSMITPSGGGADLDAFDYHQSSNRVAIERAFGMLIRRWAILWKPLAMRFDRRAPVVGACIRLHNFCIQERIAEETRVDNEISQVQPNRWAMTPKFNKQGKPVRYMKILRGERQRHPTRPSAAPHMQTRDWLAEKVRECGIVRPRLKPGQHRRNKGKGLRTG